MTITYRVTFCGVIYINEIFQYLLAIEYFKKCELLMCYTLKHDFDLTLGDDRKPALRVRLTTKI